RLEHKNVVRFQLGRRGGTDDIDANVLHYTQNSPYLAVCLAARMGARRIGLLGVDLTAGHFFGGATAHSLSRRLPQIDAEYGAVCWRTGIALCGCWMSHTRWTTPHAGHPSFKLSLSMIRRLSADIVIRTIYRCVLIHRSTSIH